MIMIIFLICIIMSQTSNSSKYKSNNKAGIDNSNISDEKILKEKEYYAYIDKRKYALLGFGTGAVMIFIISFFINKKMQARHYRRETSDLVSPILAEAIIDGKIGLKELIMTTIIELNIKGNIKIINNDTLELISCDNLEMYEKSIVDLLFKNNRITFKDINSIFSKSNEETMEFSKKMNQIKEMLLQKIFSMKIFSKGLTIVNKVIVLLAILININLPLIFLKDVGILERCFLLINFLVITSYINKNIKKTTIQEEIISTRKKSDKSIGSTLYIISMLFLIFVAIIDVAQYNMILVANILLISALNIYTAYKSQATALTKRGKIEQTKLNELKKYINDYSLIKNRDLESVIIWDKYLAYATAFGIPSKVTNSIYEGWYNLNLNLQVLEAILC